jgi:hypothetical protein
MERQLVDGGWRMAARRNQSIEQPDRRVLEDAEGRGGKGGAALHSSLSRSRERVGVRVVACREALTPALSHEWEREQDQWRRRDIGRLHPRFATKLESLK